MGFDLYPLTTLENKKKWLPRNRPRRLAGAFLSRRAQFPRPGSRGIASRQDHRRASCRRIALSDSAVGHCRRIRRVEISIHQGDTAMAKAAKKAAAKNRIRDAALKAEIGIIGGSGLYSMPGLERTREWRVQDAIRRSFRRARARHARRQARRVSFAPRARPSLHALGDQLSRQSLRHEAGSASSA